MRTGKPLRKEREARKVAGDDEALTTLGSRLVGLEETAGMMVMGFSVRRDFIGWTLSVRIWSGGERLVGFRHLNNISGMGTALLDVLESDDWASDKFQSGQKEPFTG
jgi:hypothetical protein